MGAMTNCIGLLSCHAKITEKGTRERGKKGKGKKQNIHGWLGRPTWRPMACAQP
jgi:hypothetical protein